MPYRDFSGEPPPKRQRVVLNDNPETSATTLGQPNHLPIIYPNTFPDAFTSQTLSHFGQYNPAGFIDFTGNPNPLNSWMTLNSSQTGGPPYDAWQYSQSLISSEAFNVHQDLGALTNCYMPPVASFPSHASTEFIPLGHSLPLAQTMNSMTLQMPTCLTSNPIDNPDVLTVQYGAVNPHSNGVSQHPTIATALAPPTIDPDEIVCFGVVSQPYSC